MPRPSEPSSSGTGSSAAAPDDNLIGDAWAALVDQDPDLAGTRETVAGAPGPIQITGSGGHLPSHLAVEDVAVACVASALLAAAALHRQRGASSGPPPSLVALDRAHVATAVRSDRYFGHRDGPGRGGMGFAPLSRFWRAADGWVRTHANYPWHRAALLSVLGTSDDPGAIEAAMAEREAESIEADVVAAGGVAGVVRSLETWLVHPQGRALADEPLIGHQVTGAAAPRPRAPADLPGSGVRVLDLTPVIAGPVCTRFLGALGADVLRLDPPHRPDLQAGAVADSLLAKRSAVLDLTTPDGDATLHDLLDGADVVVCGYRPGALDRFGPTPEALAERHPGIVGVHVDAWGHHGPWAGRRGFDSIVQAPTGIALLESADGNEPGALPCQLLDHGTGYLAAAAALDGLRRQARHGGSHTRRVSLARTAWWLTSISRPVPEVRPSDAVPASAPDADTRPWLVDLAGPTGMLTAVAPTGRLGDRPLAWPLPLTAYGADPPVWRAR